MRQALQAHRVSAQIDMLQALQAAVAADEVTVVERLELPARAECREPVPPAYRTGGVGRWLLGTGFR